MDELKINQHEMDNNLIVHISKWGPEIRLSTHKLISTLTLKLRGD